MTTIAPIDIEKSESAVLIDYENVRLSWEKTYCRLFTYTDLCWLCQLTEERFKTSITRIVVFMSDPAECSEICCPEQLGEMEETLKYLRLDQQRHHVRTAPLPVPQHSRNRRSMNRRLVVNSSVCVGRGNEPVDVESVPRKKAGGVEGSLRKKKRRKLMAQNVDEIVDLSSSGDESNVVGVSDSSVDDDVQITLVKDDYPFIRLGQKACPKAEVVVKVFRYKRQRNVRVQRCCDVEIGAEVTKICFMPYFSSIFLFSADSDFENTTRQCAEAEVYGGIIKYAKPIRIFGFSRAFERSTFDNARNDYLFRKNRWVAGSQKTLSDHTVDAGASFYLIDYEFPVIRRMLEKKKRPLLPPTAFRPQRLRSAPAPSSSEPNSKSEEPVSEEPLFHLSTDPQFNESCAPPLATPIVGVPFCDPGELKTRRSSYSYSYYQADGAKLYYLKPIDQIKSIDRMKLLHLNLDHGRQGSHHFFPLSNCQPIIQRE